MLRRSSDEVSDEIESAKRMIENTIKTRPLRLLILGGGAIVTECHLPALKALGWQTSCAVVEPFERNVHEVRRRYPDVKVLEMAYENVITGDISASYDAVLVALPNSLHFDACLRALNAGLPVLCEKPLATTAAQCHELDEASKRTGKPVYVGMVRRYLPSLTALRDALASGMIGDVTSIELEDGWAFMWPSDTDTVFRKDQGGVLLGMGVHFLDCLEWLFGRLKPLDYHDDAMGGVEVNCDFRLQTQADQPVALRISWTHALKNALRVTGTRGVLEMRKADVTAAHWISSDGQIQAEVKPQTAFASGDWQLTFESCFVEQFWLLERALRGVEGASQSLVTASQAAHAQELIEWAYQKPRVGSTVSNNRPSLPTAPVVVTGGTGFVGGHLIERLTELGMTEIVVPVRSFRSAANAARYPVSLRRYDLLDLESCRKVVRGARHVFHLAYGTGGAETAKITVEGTRNMLLACEAEGVESVVVFSTGSVWGAHDGEVDETSPMRPALADYGESKAQMHTETLAYARAQKRLRVSLIAPGAVYGPRGGLFCATACEMAKAGTFAWFDGGKGTCNYVHVSNLVDAAILAASKPEAHAQDFLIVDGQTTWREFFTPMVQPWLERIHEVDTNLPVPVAAKRRSTLISVAKAGLMSPRLMAEISAHPLLGWLKDQFTRRFPASHQRVQAMRPSVEYILKPVADRPQPGAWLADIFGVAGPCLISAKASKLLGWKPRVTLEEGQTGCVEWLRETSRLPQGEEN
jgi:predicted dehydrogenase/nucleoside-diphosphate-sugar epimerase